MKIKPVIEKDGVVVTVSQGHGDAFDSGLAADIFYRLILHGETGEMVFLDPVVTWRSRSPLTWKPGDGRKTAAFIVAVADVAELGSDHWWTEAKNEVGKI